MQTPTFNMESKHTSLEYVSYEKIVQAYEEIRKKYYEKNIIQPSNLNNDDKEIDTKIDKKKDEDKV